jgi:hypothetical protein
MSNDPLYELIQALRRGTRDDAIDWETADANGNDFIARRESGTVTLRGRRLGNPLAPEPAVTLVVKDAAGKNIETYDAAAPLSGLLGAGASLSTFGSPDADLRALYWDVKEQVTKARSTMNALAKEFQQKPAPKDSDSVD